MATMKWLTSIFCAVLVVAVLPVESNGQWVQLPAMQKQSVTGLLLADTYFLAGQAGSVARSTDGGKTWQSIVDGIRPVAFGLNFIGRHDSIFYATSPDGTYLSIDEGLHWRLMKYSSTQYVGVRVFTVWRDSLYSGGSAGVLVLRDSLWYRVKQDRDSNGIVRALAPDSGGMFAATSQRGVLFSTDGGYTWSSPWKGNPGIEARSILLHGDTLLASYSSRGTQRSTDHGGSWTVLGGESIYSFAEYQGVVFAGTSVGVMRSLDYGLSWEAVGRGMTDSHFVAINTLAIYSGYLYAGTNDAWIWRRPLSELLPPTVGVDEASTGVSTTSLGGAVPNPSSGTVVVPYRLGISCSVNLSVYNTVGERVAALVDEREGAGPHCATFDVSELPAGVYYYRLSAGGTVLSRSMIVAR